MPVRSPNITSDPTTNQRRPPSPIDARPGAHFGSWTVVHPVPSTDGIARVHCRCRCGNRAALAVSDLVGGKVPECDRCAKSVEASRTATAAAAAPGQHPSPPTAARPPRPGPPPRRARIVVPSVKVTLPLRPEQLPRDVLPREGAPSVPIEVTIEVAAGGGQRPLPIVATFNSRNYRRAVNAIDEHGGNVTVLIQGRLTGDRELLDAGISVQPIKTAAPSSSHA